MTETLTKPPGQGTDTAPPMVHWVDPKRRAYALCGYKIKQYVGPIQAAECVVCETMKRGS